MFLYKTLEAICKALNLPIVTIGGMNMKTIPLCAPYGVQGFAVVSALVSQPDVFLAAKVLKRCSKVCVFPGSSATRFL
ncbi:MAG: thiamine phosphate synthase [Sphaerochaetaceae bacterium]